MRASSVNEINIYIDSTSSYFSSFDAFIAFSHINCELQLNRYEHQDIALNCGTMLRECARYEALAKIILNSEDFYKFFEYVEVSTFDIASDAFSTFKVGRITDGMTIINLKALGISRLICNGSVKFRNC